MMANNRQEYSVIEGQYVMIQCNKLLKSFQAKCGVQVRMEKAKFMLDGIIGCPFGSTFEVQRNQLVPCVLKEDEQEDTANVMSRDNRSLEDKQDNQKLVSDDIQALKKDGIHGKVIISQLVENSATFGKKTEYSQQKYLNRKKKKHLVHFTVLRPNSRLMAQMYFSRGPTKICNMRMDSLAQILTYSNVRVNSRLIVHESVCGLVIGALMERMAGQGRLIHFYQGSVPARPILSNLNFPAEYFDTLLSCSLDQVANVKAAIETLQAAVKQKQKGALTLKRVEEAQGKEEESTESQGHSDDASARKRSKVTVEETQTNRSSRSETRTRKSSRSETRTQESCRSETRIRESSESETRTQQSSDARLDTMNEHKAVAEDASQVADDVEKASDDAATCSEAVKQAGKLSDSQEGQGSNPCVQTLTENMQTSQRKRGGKKRDCRGKKKDHIEEQSERLARRELRQQEQDRVCLELAGRDMDGLVVVSRFHPTNIVLNLLEYVAPSRPVVIFSQYRQPIIDCYNHLKESGRIINLRLSETWFRNYQILPNRSHPEVQMSGTGGYLLTGTTVSSS